MSISFSFAVVLLIPLGALVLACMVTSASLQRYLRQHHRAAWESLGSPSFLNSTVINSVGFLWFMFGLKYRRLNDPAFNNKAAVFFILYAITFSALLVLSHLSLHAHVRT
jgi:hypothetical protein